VRLFLAWPNPSFHRTCAKSRARPVNSNVKLISYFRNSDHTSAIVGQRQASTFQALATLSGKTDGTPRAAAPKAKRAESPIPKAAKAKASAKTPLAAEIPAAPKAPPASPATGAGNTSGMALTVRVEINLPAGGDQETYDRIFKSIRENLLNGNAF